MNPKSTIQLHESEFCNSDFVFSPEVETALAENRPIVALESTVIAHGLPSPHNLKLGLELENTVREEGSTPATIAVFGGKPHIGLTRAQLELLASSDQIIKLSTRDLPIAVARKLDGATTVATTAFFAFRAGIRVFATGGIGGVHRGAFPDVSADLPALAKTPITVVCAGAKAILDLPATREWLETNGVTILGWQTNEFPAFYARTSELKVDARVENACEVAEIARARDNLKLKNAVLLTVPVPAEFEIEPAIVEKKLAEALTEAAREKIAGKEITPFLLSRLTEKSGGATLRANLALLRHNAQVAARVAAAMHGVKPIHKTLW